MPDLREIEKLNRERSRLSTMANLIDDVFFLDAESIKILEANNIAVEEFTEFIGLQSKFYNPSDMAMHGFSSENLFLTDKDLNVVRKILGASKNDLAYIISKDIMTKTLTKFSDNNLNSDRRDIYYQLLENLRMAISRLSIDDRDDLLLSINRINHLVIIDPTDLTRIDRWDSEMLERECRYLKDVEDNIVIITEGFSNIVIFKNNLIVELIKGSVITQNKLYEDLLSHTYTNKDVSIFYSKLFSAYIAS